MLGKTVFISGRGEWENAMNRSKSLLTFTPHLGRIVSAIVLKLFWPMTMDIAFVSPNLPAEMASSA
jgi:hypothetical protein